MNPQYSQKIKTLLMLLIVVLVIFAVAGVAYFFLKQTRPTASEPTEPNNGNATTFTPINTSNNEAGRGNGQGTSTQTSSEVGATTTTEPAKIVELVSTPVSGAVSTTTPMGLVIRYVDKATGHIFEIPDGSINSSRITNTTVPKSIKTAWSPNGGDLLFSYMRQSNSPLLDTYMHINDIFPKSIGVNSVSSIASTTTNGTSNLLTTKTSVVGNSNQAIALSPSGKKIFYIKDDGSGGNQRFGAYISNSDGTATSRVWSTSISGWVIDWIREGGAKVDPLVAIYVKPISMGTGFGYLFNPNTKNMDKVGQGGKGFTMKVNPSITYAVTATTDNNRVNTSFVNIKTNTSTIAPFSTFPEKCAWSRINDKVVYCAVPNNIEQSEYPESWYMGDTVFTDHIWKVNIETGQITKLADLLSDTDELIDATDLNLAPQDEYLTFIKKDDSSLWMLKLK